MAAPGHTAAVAVRVLAALIAMPAAASRPSFVVLHSTAKQSFGEHPISKVVAMMEELKKEEETNVKMEQDLFDTYACWKNTVVSAKKASNAEASDRIGSLTSYIDDIDSGRIEFSTEGADLTKEVQELRGEIEKASALRKKDHDDFLAAKDEMESSISALEKAKEHMDEGTKEGLIHLRQIVQFGKALLPPADVALLERAATSGNLRQPDFKKMNKKKEFNMKYVPRSDKIKELISDMLQTFKDNLAEAEDKEKDAKATFEKLKSAKDSQLEAAENALAEMGGETAAREEAKEEANNEIKTLEEQIKTDNGFIDDVVKAYEEKLGEWKERKKLMTEEISGISEAIAILMSDEARDAMSKTFDKDKVFNSAALIQVHVRSERGAAKAAEGLRRFAERHHLASSRLRHVALAMMEDRSGGAFDKAIELLNNIKKDLNKEAAEDARLGEQCEKDLVEKTTDAQASSNFIDEKASFINRTKFEVAELWALVNKTVEEVEDAEWELNDATMEREKYHEAFLQERASLTTAVDFIKQAKEALEKFFKDNGLALMQRSSSNRHTSTQPGASIIVEAGKEPPPPPAIITEPYEGHGGNTNIQSILQQVADDVTKDKEDLEKAEEESVKAFEGMKADTETSISEKMDLKAETEKEIAEKLVDISDANEAKVGEKMELDATVKALKTMEPDCDYVFTTRDVRARNRALECEGTNAALESLEADPKEVECTDAAMEEM